MTYQIPDINGNKITIDDTERLAHFINGDCMKGMKQFPDDYFDLAIVDPPYGVGTVTYMPRQRQKGFGGYIDKYDVVIATLDMAQRNIVKIDVEHDSNSKSIIKGFGDFNVAPPPNYFEELMRVSKNQIIWGGNYYLLPPSRCFVCWNKMTVTENFSMAMCEYAWTSFNANAKLFSGAPQGTAANPRIHPTEKPIKLYQFLLKHFAKPGNRILDTHVGSASSLIACHRAGYEFVGFEIDEEYYKAAQGRLERDMAQMTLFDIVDKQGQA